jgi:hypothetical protein
LEAESDFVQFAFKELEGRVDLVFAGLALLTIERVNPDALLAGPSRAQNETEG